MMLRRSTNQNPKRSASHLPATRRKKLQSGQRIRPSVAGHRANKPRKAGSIRYAVVGLGHIAQTAVLPAFANAARNSQLVALVSDDAVKRRALQRQYQVPHGGSYADYEALLQSGNVDAVYIALPNSLHCDFTVRAARAGVHVLCEKPLAVSEKECRRMIEACRHNSVKLMTAYRLHFEEANLKAIALAQSGKLGELRLFNSVFSFQARAGNVRLQQDLGGGPLYDLGVYCINAARCLFQAEPLEVGALTAASGDKRFREVEEMAGAILRFPRERLATFICSHGACYAAAYDLIGTQGSLHANNAYAYAGPITWKLTLDGKTQTRSFAPRDQFAPELIYFSDCVLQGREPEPSGIEGLNDVCIVQAIYQSARAGRPVKLNNLARKLWPSLQQEIRRPSIAAPEPIRAAAPTQ